MESAVTSEQGVEQTLESILKLSRLPRVRKLLILRRITEEIIRETAAQEAVEFTTALSPDPIESAGGTVSAEEFGKLVNLSRTTINDYRLKKKLLALPQANSYRYPVFQQKDGAILPGVAEIISILEKFGISNPRAQTLFLLSHHHSRNGPSHRPIDLLEAGDTEMAIDLILINAKK